jgi:hypothetical protein
MVAWIWVATGVMALGGLAALVPARRTQPAFAPSLRSGALAVEEPQ